MQATLTELRRQTTRVIRPVIHSGQTVLLTEHGRPIARLVPVQVDRPAALAALQAIGPVDLPTRQP